MLRAVVSATSRRPIELPADAAAIFLARFECEWRLQAGHRLDEIDEYIRALPIAETSRDDLFLYAWTWPRARVPGEDD
jgi:hypothetical protein